MATRLRDIARRSAVRSYNGKKLMKWVLRDKLTGNLVPFSYWARQTGVLFTPNKWMEQGGTIVKCENGFHCTHEGGVGKWRPAFCGPAFRMELWQVEVAGVVLKPGNDGYEKNDKKFCSQYIKLVKRVK